VKKILFFPLLKMQSGHHQVAEALMHLLSTHLDDVTVKKIDLMSDTNKVLEKIISAGYLKWIRHLPATYNKAYKNMFYGAESRETEFKWYQPLFTRKMLQIIDEENPDLIICTHSFPSTILSKLKMKGKCDVPVINVYTDFFVNCVWGRKGIDAHFLPSREVKLQLMNQKSTPANMFVTGIPVHEEIQKRKIKKESDFKAADRPNILIAGGNSGLGSIARLLDGLQESSDFNFLVLCGNNRKLYEDIKGWNSDHIKPLPYLSSREEMNELYDQADAIVTKPGGVTISEALKKKLPIFIHSALPGQEEINMKYLKAEGLVFELDLEASLEEQLKTVMMDETRLRRLQGAVERYEQELEIYTDLQLAEVIRVILKGRQNMQEVLIRNNAGLLFPLRD